MDVFQKIEIIKGDITRVQVDAIVNAANQSLLAGGGVCGAIHHAGGPQLEVECRLLGGCPTGEAKITKGYLLPADYVIHTVGPVWHGGNFNERELLASCYRSCLELAMDHNLKTIAFPNISTGIFGFPRELACDVALETVIAQLMNVVDVELVYFVCFDDDQYHLYLDKLKELVDLIHNI